MDKMFESYCERLSELNEGALPKIPKVGEIFDVDIKGIKYTVKIDSIGKSSAMATITEIEKDAKVGPYKVGQQVNIYKGINYK
jgi:hypothetical protein